MLSRRFGIHRKLRKTGKVNFTIHVRNFGPVSDAKILLKPLTIFVGPNNSGKSYTAMLIYSIVSSYEQIYGYPNTLIRQYQDRFEHTIDEIKKLDIKDDQTTIPNTIINYIIESCFKAIFDEIHAQINRNFASKLNDLVQINKTSFNIGLHDSERIRIRYENNLLKPEFPKLKIKATVSEERLHNFAFASIDTNDHISCKISSKLDKYAIFELSEQLQITISERISRNIPTQSYYLPAARSGILQGHRAITTSIIRNTPYAGIAGTQIPPLSGVVADFLSLIISTHSHEGEFYKYAEQLEFDILNGRIKLYVEKYKHPEIKYIFMDHEIPLHRTSSTVSELAPLVLYLKHIVRKGDLLIIEEPEAHLHPANQLILARHIARLIRAGLNILITTHSAFLLEQLSLLLQASKVDSATRKTMGLNNNEYLTEDDVSPYLFSQITTGDHVAKPIECSSEDGISQEEFVNSQEALYDQTIRIEQKTLD